jgi:hypothetical protein
MFDDGDDVVYEDADGYAQAKWEEEAHYWHTLTALADLIEERGFDAVMADVQDVLDKRSEAVSEPLTSIGGLPFPDLSFLSIRKGPTHE